MKDKELRKLIGSRAKQRRLELNLTQPYVAEKMGVTASTILRYENGSIDNTKKMVLEGLSEALHVSIEWLKGETDEYETDITDKKELQIRDAMGDILKQFPLDLNKTEDAFSKDLLLLMLKQYELFLDSFQFACKNYKGSTKDADIAKVMGFESKDEYNEIMFLREITHTVNAFNDMADVIRLYSKKPEAAEIVMGHNREDLLGLGKIFSMLSYLALFNEDYEALNCEIQDDQLAFTIKTNYDLPVEFSNHSEEFYIIGQNNRVRLLVKLQNGRLKQYYSNYKDYDYIPSEDTAIPKTLSACMDKKLRRPAKRDNCYTWFPVTEAFLHDPLKQKTYLKHCLPYYLSVLK